MILYLYVNVIFNIYDNDVSSYTFFICYYILEVYFISARVLVNFWSSHCLEKVK